MGRFLRSVAVIASIFVSTLAFAQQLSIKPDHASGLYNAGETVTWTITADKPEAFTQTHYRVKTGGLTVSNEADFSFSEGSARVSATSPASGWLLLEVTAKNAEGKKVSKLGGAVFSPEQITPAVPAPDDFDAFWSAKLQELAAVPANPALTPADAGRAGVEYYNIRMANIRGTSIYGQLAKPAKEGKFPAMLIVQWAGVYPLQKHWVTTPAAEGWLALNISAHDLPINEPAEFYKQQGDGPLNAYFALGNDDRETSYFLRMYLSCYRAVEYLSERPDWDGKILVASGSSQGGLQSFIAAGLNPKVTSILALVPAGCDNSGKDAGRAPGWPGWIYQAKGKDLEKVKQAARYYDVVNFAKRTKASALIAIGAIDTTCPAPGVYAAANQMTGHKEVILMPLSDHKGPHDVYNPRRGAWLNALKTTGQPPTAQLASER